MTDVRRSDDEWQSRLQGERQSGLAALFAAYRDRLRVALELRMDPRLYARIDPSDVIQESFVEAQGRLANYLDSPDLPPYLWIRFLTLQRLVTTYRKIVDVQARDARRDRSLDAPLPEASSACLAARLVDDGTSPSQAAMRRERHERLHRLIDELDPMDREIIALRHFEQLSNAEVSKLLNLKPATASQRYLRALKRLKNVLLNSPGESNDST